MLKLFALAAFAARLAAPAGAEGVHRRLVLVGGGDHPAEAKERFARWAGGAKAHILVVGWSTVDPQGSLQDATADFHPAAVELAVATPTLTAAAFQDQLNRATGVWFSGGDQVLHMKALQSNGGAPLEAARRRFREGIPFGGTSAGTAVMSKIMITGEGNFTVIDGRTVETAEGLGLLDEKIIIDQHFIKRQRLNRLIGVMLQHRDHTGVGIDESTAALIEDGRFEVCGAGAVVVVHPAPGKTDDVSIEVIRPGQSYDLILQRRIPADAP